jgi:hypothetical protein
VAAARHGLMTPGDPIIVDSWRAARVLELAAFDRLDGFLAVAAAEGVVVLDAKTTGALTEQWHAALRAAVSLEAVVVRTAAVLDASEVRYRLTKGAAVAHLDYPDPAVRTFGDVDLVVHPEDWTAALGSLEGAGYHRKAVEIPYDFDRRYGKGATLLDPHGYEVDLHRRFAIGRYGVTSLMADVFGGADCIELAGRRVAVLTPEYRLLHACYHAALGGFRRLRAFRDVAQLVLVTGVSVDAVMSIAARWRAKVVVAAALAETWRRLDLDPTAPELCGTLGLPIGRGDRRALAVFAQERPFRQQALTALGRLGPLDTIRYLYTLGAHNVARRNRARPQAG